VYKRRERRHCFKNIIKVFKNAITSASPRGDAPRDWFAATDA